MSNLSRTKMFKLVEAFKKAGLSRKDFISKHRINLNTFNWWYYRFRKEEKFPEKNPMFVPVIHGAEPRPIVNKPYAYIFSDGAKFIFPAHTPVSQIVSVVQSFQAIPCSR